MKSLRNLWLIASLLAVAAVWAQAPAAPAAQAPSLDPVVAAAEFWIGRALILRGFYAGGELEYDPAGRIRNPGKMVDWTLAGMNVEKVSRRAPGELQLDGTRVAICYNPDQHQFDRHPLKESHIRVLFPAGDAVGVNKVMAAIFSTGIDPALQRSMPPFWKHYFLPAEPWTGDGLEGVAVVPANSTLPAGAVLPVAEKQPEPEYTEEARVDRVKGTVVLKLVVDAEGATQRVTIRQPLGYGLDARASEAVMHWRFRPGTVAGKPATMEVVVNQGFDFAASPR